MNATTGETVRIGKLLKLTGKKQEWDDYRTSISQWEVDRYLIRY